MAIVTISMFQLSSFFFILPFAQLFVGYVSSNKIICPPGKAQFPNPYDHHSFYKCDAGGNPILFPCPAKTWFNPCLEVCDWDTGNYYCQNTGGAGNPSNQGSNGNGNSAGNGNRPHDQPIPSNHGGYKPEPNVPSSGTNQASSQPTKLAPNQSCSIYGQLYQNPEDCSSYFMCNMQKLVLVQCTRGYFYIPERKRCETTFPTGCKFVENNVGDYKPIYETENDVWQYQRSLKG